MNKLSAETRAKILHLLCEGSSLRAVTRITGVSINTVTKLLVDAGKACTAFQDQAFRNLSCNRIQCDEIWSFVYSKAKNVPAEKLGNAGDVWTWTAIDADTKLVMSWMIGNRDAGSAKEFMQDLSSRLANRVQLTTDGHKAYLKAVSSAFGNEIDYAMLVKIYGEDVSGQKRYSPADVIGTKVETISGKPVESEINTSYVERQNLTMRMHMRRFTRLTNAFSKKVENHAYSVALHFMYYNFVRIHKTLKVTPAMAAGVSDKLWEISDIVALMDAAESAPAKRGPYKKRG
jgi:IS1 family transposase